MTLWQVEMKGGMVVHDEGYIKQGVAFVGRSVARGSASHGGFSVDQEHIWRPNHNCRICPRPGVWGGNGIWTNS